MPSWVETVIQSVAGLGGLGLVGWLAKRQVDRIDALVEAMKGKAEREEMQAVTERIFDKLDEHARESRTSMSKMHEKLDKAIAEQNKINLEVARNLGRD